MDRLVTTVGWVMVAPILMLMVFFIYVLVAEKNHSKTVRWDAALGYKECSELVYGTPYAASRDINSFWMAGCMAMHEKSFKERHD